MKTILVLEDDLGNMQAFCAILSTMGYRVLEATTGDEAIETCNRHEPISLLVSDMALPDASGTEVALRLTRQQPDLPILFLSGTPIEAWSESDRRNFRRLSFGPVEFLEKPFRVVALKTKVESLMHSRCPVSGARPR